MEVEEDLDIHYYVLYCQSLKIEKLYYVFNNQKDVEAFIPNMKNISDQKIKSSLTLCFLDISLLKQVKIK